MLPFLVAGLGMVGAGLVLDIVQVNYLYYYHNQYITSVALEGRYHVIYGNHY